MEEEAPLVYSTDPNFKPASKRSKKIDTPVDLESFTALVRIEKSGRKGKTVTVIERIPASEPFLSMLSKLMKTRCGAGGTFGQGKAGGFVEIQGDKREQVRKILSEKGIAFKG